MNQYNTIPQQISYDHDSSLFKNSLIGRCTSDEGQNVMPSFVLGWKYLIFMDTPVHIRSYEIIRSEDDSWLRYVKKTVAGQSEKSQLIRLRAGLREAAIHAFCIHKETPDVDRNMISNMGLKYLRDNPKATNADLKAFMYDPETIRKAQAFELCVEGNLTTNTAPPRGAEGGSGSKKSTD